MANKISARTKLYNFFASNPNTPVHTTSLAKVAKIKDYLRRVRELRESGMNVQFFGNGYYVNVTNKKKAVSAFKTTLNSK